MILTTEEFNTLYEFVTVVHLHDGSVILSKENFDNIKDTIESQQQTIEQLRNVIEEMRGGFTETDKDRLIGELTVFNAKQRKALEQAKTLLDRLITPGPAVLDSEIRTVLKQIAEVEGC